MKGVSMPIRAMMLLAIAFIVVIVLLMAFVTSVGSKTASQSMNEFITTNCFKLRNVDRCGLKLCSEGNPNGISETLSRYSRLSTIIDQRSISLSEACRRVYGTTDILECCGCRSRTELEQECQSIAQGP